MSAAALAQARGFLLVITDTTGPIGSQYMPTSWRHLEQSVIEQLVRAAWPSRNVLSVTWAEDPAQYTVSGDVLLVEVPGVHEVKVVAGPRLHVPKARKPVEPEEAVDLERWSPTYWKSRGNLGLAPATPARSPTGPDVVVNTCTTCGTAYTAATFAALPLLGAKDVREGGTVIHETYRNCTCGSTRMIFSTRIAGEKP